MTPKAARIKPFREILLTRVFESRPRAAILAAGCVFLLSSIGPSFLIAKTGSWDWSPLFVIGGLVAGLAAGPVIGVLCVVAQTSLVIASFGLGLGALPQQSGVLPLGVLIHILVAAIMGYLGAMNLFLRKTVRELNTLRGILPICASCKKIRDDKGYWHQVENYMRDHAKMEFSHGICPECAAKLYAELKDEKPHPG